MDPRKQKRLGPAPIASFEKSFEENTSAPIGNTVIGASYVLTAEAGQTGAAVDSKDNENGKNIEPHAKLTTMTTKNSVTNYKDSTQSNISSVDSGSIIETSTSTSTSTSGTARTITKADDSTSTITKRPPPLKSTTANPATTTLVSSGEQQMVVVTTAFKGTTTLMTPSTPRIELSRASSSSHQEEDSRESSPENVFEQVGTGTLQETIGVGFREDGALELRSSTEELFFMDPEQKKEEQEKVQQQQQQTKRTSPHLFKFDDHQSYLQQHQRKDSASSEVAALLCISGRSSRISSVGSQGSAVSHLSAISGISRSPSPHRMLLETSFCGPKPLQNVVDGGVVTTVEPPTAELLEQMLLSRKHDPTQVVLAEGIKVESSPKKKPTSLSNGDPTLTAKITAQNRPSAVKSSTMGAQRRSTKSPGQMVVGKTPSGTEYIRINLKPDHMYEDKGIAPHERIVEAPNTLMPAYSRVQKKPVTLSLGSRNAVVDENHLTPTASPKPTRHGAIAKDTAGSRSPSPAAVSVSRKSSFSSLFRLGGKDSPDSPRDRSRPRSKSKDRQKPQSQNATPSKQKSVLAIFTTGKRGSSAGNDAKSSKSSSPIDPHEIQSQRSRQTPTPIMTATGSRPASRLRYYDEPVEGCIHIPLHTPPEEKETRQLLESIQQLNAEPPKQATAAITPGQLAAAAAALKPVGTRKGSGAGIRPPPPPPPPRPQPQQIEKVQRIENLDAIHSLPQDEDGNKDRSWSLEVNRHSSQDSQETVGSETSCASAIKVTSRSQLANVKEHVVQENGTVEAEASAEIHRLSSIDSATSAGEPKVIETVATINATNIMIQQKDIAAAAKEKRKMLFATRLGSGSQEQIFATQFSISKTESQSSQLSEQVHPNEKTIFESSEIESLQRQGTVKHKCTEDQRSGVKRLDSTEVAMQRTKSVSTSEDEKSIVRTTTVSAVVIRRKESSDELRQKSTSDDDAANAVVGINTQRHSRYLENFDVRKNYQENLPRKPRRQSTVDSSKFDSDVEAMEKEASVNTSVELRAKPTIPQPPPPSTAPSPSPPLRAVSGSRSPTPPKEPLRSQSQSPVDRARQTPTKPPRSSTPTRRTQVTPPPVPAPAPPKIPTATEKSTLKKPIQLDRQSVHSTDEPIESSESERDSDLVASAAIDPKRHHLPRHVGVIEDHESTGLVSQESFDDELPYIPTTLPEERAHGVSLIPMKERANMELKTFPVDRPRSTTPLNPSHLEEYCGIVTPQEPINELSRSAPIRGEKLRISLPRKDSIKDKVPQNAKSPRRISNASGKSWFEFAEEGLRATAGNLERKDSNKQLMQQKPKVDIATAASTKRVTTPKAAGCNRIATTTVQSTKSGTTSTQRKLSGHWIDFENIPEKRKPPKRITTLPKDTLASSSRGHHGSSHGHHHAQQPPPSKEHTTTPTGGEDGKLHYNYVKPEDCQCECHDAERESSGTTMNVAGTTTSSTGTASCKEVGNVEKLQGEDLLPLLDSETHDGIEPSDSSREYSYYTDDEMDVPMRQSGSSRSKSSSSKLDEFPRRDKSPSPRNKRFPDNRK